jgi:outer membrane protein
MIMLPVLLLLAIAGPQPADTTPIDITLDDCIRLALTNNLPLQVSRLDAEGSIQNFNSTWGQFDTTYFIETSVDRRTSAPTPSNFVGGVNVGESAATKVDTLSFVTGLRGELLTGTLWEFDVGPHASKVAVPNSGGDPGFESEVFTGNWSLSVTQPLLRNGADDYAISGLELARHDATIAALNAESVASTTLQTVTVAYWNLVFARQTVKTGIESVDLATELRDITQRKFEQGLQNRINVTEVEAELATRQEELLTARNQAESAQDLLRRLVFAPQDRETWNRELRPVTAPAPAEPVTIDVDAAIDVAMKYRADVASAQQVLDRSEVDERRARNQARPRLDLTGSYGLNANEQSYGSVVSNLDDTTFNEQRIALSFELPLGNRGAGYALRTAQLARQRAGVTLRDAELQTITDVRTAAREVQLQIERVAATAESTRLNRETYEGEKRRLENDLSTPFLVKQAQRDLLTATDIETRAQLDLEVARAGLLFAEGRLIYAYGLERSTPELSLDEPPPKP